MFSFNVELDAYLSEFPFLIQHIDRQRLINVTIRRANRMLLYKKHGLLLLNQEGGLICETNTHARVGRTLWNVRSWFRLERLVDALPTIKDPGEIYYILEFHDRAGSLYHARLHIPLRGYNIIDWLQELGHRNVTARQAGIQKELAAINAC